MQEAANLRIQIDQQTNETLASNATQLQAIKAELEAASNEGNVAAYMQALSDQNVAFMADLQARQELMQTYYDWRMEAEQSYTSIMLDMANTLKQGLASAFSNAIVYGKNFGSCIADLGKKIVAMFIEWQVNRLIASVLSKNLMKQETAAGIAQGTQLAAAYNSSYRRKPIRGGNNMQAGQVIQDGTVKYIVRDRLDGTPIGRVILDSILRPSYLKAWGQTITREEYPTLARFIEDNPEMAVADNTSDANRFYFGTGDGSTTMVLPNLQGCFMRAASSGVGQGTYQGDAIRDIVGRFTFKTGGGGGPICADGDGGLFFSGSSSCLAFTGNAWETGSPNALNFAASRVVPTAGENRPINISYIPAIKY